MGFLQPFFAQRLEDSPSGMQHTNDLDSRIGSYHHLDNCGRRPFLPQLVHSEAAMIFDALQLVYRQRECVHILQLSWLAKASSRACLFHLRPKSPLKSGSRAMTLIIAIGLQDICNMVLR